MRESELEKQFCEYAESKGCESLKLRIDGQNGFPDRSVLTPGGDVVFIEFKRPGGGNVQQNQQRWINRLRQLGFFAIITDDLDAAKELLDKILKVSERRLNRGLVRALFDASLAVRGGKVQASCGNCSTAVGLPVLCDDCRGRENV